MYKIGALTAELPASRPPRSRTALYPLIRRAPSTGWVVASGRWRCRAPRDEIPYWRSRPARAPARHLPQADSGGPAPQRLRAHPGSSRGPHLDGFTIHKRRTEDTSPSELPRPFAFQTTPTPWPVHPPKAESGEIESQPFLAALVSSEARPLAGSLSMRAPGGIRTLR